MIDWLNLYGLALGGGFLGALVLGGVVRRLGRRLATPSRRSSGEARRTVSRLGGVAVLVTFGGVAFLHPQLVLSGPMLGLLAGLAVIVVLGIWDDFKSLAPVTQLAGQTLAATLPIVGGLRLYGVTEPGGGFVSLDFWQVGALALPEMLLVVVWLVVMMNALNWLDGIDGLATGVGTVAALTLFFLSVSGAVNQPPVAVLALALGGALLGFLIFNWPPARLFLGSAGSVGLGFILGTLAVIAGSKLATAALVLSLPLADAGAVLWQRLRDRQAPWRPDFRHFQFRLRRRGLSDRQILGWAAGASVIFGALALLLPRPVKLLFLTGLFLAVVGLLARRSKRDLRI